jgi:hypothetical protein
MPAEKKGTGVGQSFHSRRFASALAVAVAAGGAVIVTALPAGAAGVACVVPDLYARHAVDPGAVSGGVRVAGAKFGAAAAVGDFNHDGFGDVAVGAPSDQVGGVAAGAVYVFSGSAGGVSVGSRLTQTNVSTGNEAGDRFGAALAAGDFNKDGFADLAVGIPGEAVGSATKAGAIAVFAGKAGGLSTGTWLDQTTGGGSSEASDGFGTALAAGDLNGDGFGDLAIGTPGEAPAGGTVHGGAVYVYKGSSTGVVRGWSATQEDAAGATEAGDRFGAALAIGNVTGDSHADLVVGSPGEAPGTGPANSGAVSVVPGASAGKGRGFDRFQSNAGGANEAGDLLGAAVAVGDFDKDGFADIAAGVPGEAPGSAPAGGSILVFPGASSQVAAGYWVQESGGGETITAGDKFGSALAARDVDGDGFADLMVGAPGKSYGTATAAGTAYLFNGKVREAGSTISLEVGRRIAQTDVKASNESNDAFGSAVALGDVTGDGKADGVVGASGEAPPGQPASGTAVQLSKLAGGPAASVPIDHFSAVAAMQATPASGAAVGTLEYAYTDNIGRLVHGHQSDPNSFSSVQWTTVSGLEAYSGKPALGEQANGLVQLVGHNVSGAVWTDTEATKDPVAWGPWVNEHGAMASHAALARQSDGTLVTFAVDGNGVLWALPENGANGPYTGWISLGIGGLVGTPVTVTTSAGVQVFALDSTGDLKTALFSNRMVSGCTGLGGIGLNGSPSVVLLPGSKLRVFARAADGSIVTQAQGASGVFPSVWDTVGAFSSGGSPSALLDPVTGVIEVVARDAAGAIFSTGETAQGSGVWRDWVDTTLAGDVAATDLTAFPFTTGSATTWAFVFRLGDNTVRFYEARQPGLSAQARAPGGGPEFGAHTLPEPRK